KPLCSRDIPSLVSRKYTYVEHRKNSYNASNISATTADRPKPRPTAEVIYMVGIGFTRTPNKVLLDKRLKVGERLLYLAMLMLDFNQKKGFIYYSEERLSEMLGISGALAKPPDPNPFRKMRFCACRYRMPQQFSAAQTKWRTPRSRGMSR